MNFELWLFAVKQLAQNYAVSQVIYSQLSQAEKDELHREYEATVGGGVKEEAKPKENKTIKEYNDLMYNFHNAMSITERFLEKNNLRRINASLPVDATNADEEFLRRLFIKMENSTLQVVRYLNYLSKKVSKEGKLQRNMDGSYSLEGTPIREGMLIEFFHINRWEIGRLCRVPGSIYGYFFLGFMNETFDVELPGLHVRIRE